MEMPRSLTEAQLDGKRVLLRAGFDVPIEDGVVTDASRIESLIPTMKYILERGASLVIIAHQDRPKGKVVPQMSQRPLIPVLEKLLNRTILFADSVTGENTQQMVDALSPGQVLLLENLRFDPREEVNDEGFAREVAAYADVYVNDAFSNAHREHTSMVAVAKLLPAFMGLNLEQEIKHLMKVTSNPDHPLTLVICGAKIETKLPVIEFFMNRGDDILVGGAIANTVALAQGHAVGFSLAEADFLDTAKKLLAMSGTENNARLHAFSDALIASDKDDTSPEEVPIDNVPADKAIFDAGPATVDAFSTIIAASKTIIWNGPVGMYEQEQFAGASMSIARAIAYATAQGATSIVGGGDTIDFHTMYGLPLDAYTFVSTGGGAMLDFVSGKTLPAISALQHD